MKKFKFSNYGLTVGQQAPEPKVFSQHILETFSKPIKKPEVPKVSAKLGVGKQVKVSAKLGVGKQIPTPEILPQYPNFEGFATLGFQLNDVRKSFSGKNQTLAEELVGKFKDWFNKKYYYSPEPGVKPPRYHIEDVASDIAGVVYTAVFVGLMGNWVQNVIDYKLAMKEYTKMETSALNTFVKYGDSDIPVDKDWIKNTYRYSVKTYHPDLHPNDSNAKEIMAEINKAYEILNGRIITKNVLLNFIKHASNIKINIPDFWQSKFVDLKQLTEVANTFIKTGDPDVTAVLGDNPITMGDLVSVPIETANNIKVPPIQSVVQDLPAQIVSEELTKTPQPIVPEKPMVLPPTEVKPEVKAEVKPVAPKVEPIEVKPVVPEKVQPVALEETNQIPIPEFKVSASDGFTREQKESIVTKLLIARTKLLKEEGFDFVPYLSLNDAKTLDNGSHAFEPSKLFIKKIPYFQKMGYIEEVKGNFAEKWKLTDLGRQAVEMGRIVEGSVGNK